jgi:hypothetical protein
MPELTNLFLQVFICVLVEVFICVLVVQEPPGTFIRLPEFAATCFKCAKKKSTKLFFEKRELTQTLMKSVNK